MLIGDVAKGTQIKIVGNYNDQEYEFDTLAIGPGAQKIELIVKPIIINNRLADFSKMKDIRVNVIGSSNITFDVNEISKVYDSGRMYHCIISRERVSTVNRRETFRMPFVVACVVSCRGHKLRGYTRDISVEGISFKLDIEDLDKIEENCRVNVEFHYGIPEVTYDVTCRVVRVTVLDEYDKFFTVGCKAERSGNSLRSLTMHLQLEEVRRQRNSVMK